MVRIILVTTLSTILVFFAGCQTPTFVRLVDRWPRGTIKRERQALRMPDGRTVLHGSQVHYHKDGGKRLATSFRNGKLHGNWVVWHPNGQVAERGLYENGKRVRIWQAWHENGERAWRTTYEAGTPVGESMGWHPNGKKAWQRGYTDGSVAWAAFWDEEGALVRGSLPEEDGPTVRECLARLDELKAAGLLTDEEYAARRDALLVIGSRALREETLSRAELQDRLEVLARAHEAGLLEEEEYKTRHAELSDRLNALQNEDKEEKEEPTEEAGSGNETGETGGRDAGNSEAGGSAETAAERTVDKKGPVEREEKPASRASDESGKKR